MLIVFLGQTGYQSGKTGFKSIISFTDLHKNIIPCKANNFMYYAL